MKTTQISRIVFCIVAAMAMLFAQAVLAQRPGGNRPKRPNPNRPNQRSRGADATSAESADAKLASDSTSIVSAESALLLSTVEGSKVASKPAAGRRRPMAAAFAAPYSVPTAAEVAMYIAAHASSRYQPVTCLTSSLDGPTVTLVFNACTGPRGLRQLTGQLVEVVSVDTAGIHIHASATSLQIGQATMNIDSSATYTHSNGAKSMQVMTFGAGTGPLGNNILREGDYTTTWTVSCATVNGSWQSIRGEASRSTQVNNLTHCNGGCPANGGSITHTHSGGVSITITFDGSAVAHWTTTNGKSGTINLVCIP